MADVTIKVQPKSDPETPKIDLVTVAAVADKLKRLDIDPAHIKAVVEKLKNSDTPVEDACEAVVDKLKELGNDPAKVVAAFEKIKKLLPPKLGFTLDPVTAATVLTTGVGVINKLNIGDTAKGLLIKLAIFVFGIFCGIGIVYQSGLPLPSDEAAVTPPANVSVYQKRIEELQTENGELRKLLERPPQPLPKEQPKEQPHDPNEPPLWPLPKEQPKTPPVVRPQQGEIRPGFVIPR